MERMLIQSDGDIEADQEEASQYFDLAAEVRRKAPRKLSKMDSDHKNGQTVKTEKLPKVKFVQQPKTTLVKFYGNLVDWPSWWENFKTVIDGNNLSAETKMVYLQSLVEGDAKVAIQEHYEMAKKILVERYGSHKEVTADTLEVDTSRLKTRSDAEVAENSEKPLDESIEKCRESLSGYVEFVHHSEENSAGKSTKKIASHSDIVVGEPACINLQEAENGKHRSLDGDVHQEERSELVKSQIQKDAESTKQRMEKKLKFGPNVPKVKNKNTVESEINLRQGVDTHLSKKSKMKVNLEAVEKTDTDVAQSAELLSEIQKLEPEYRRSKSEQSEKLQTELVGLMEMRQIDLKKELQSEISFMKVDLKADTDHVSKPEKKVDTEVSKAEDQKEEISQTEWFKNARIAQKTIRRNRKQVLKVHRCPGRISGFESQNTELKYNFKRTRKKETVAYIGDKLSGGGDTLARNKEDIGGKIFDGEESPTKIEEDSGGKLFGGIDIPTRNSDEHEVQNQLRQKKQKTTVKKPRSLVKLSNQMKWSRIPEKVTAGCRERRYSHMIIIGNYGGL